MNRDPGVGKTAIVDGLAQRIHPATSPKGLRDKPIFAFGMESLVAGAKLRKPMPDGLTRTFCPLRPLNLTGIRVRGGTEAPGTEGE